MADTSRSSILFRALSNSVDSGLFLDTKFYVFSRRRKSGEVDLPLAVYASSYVLKQKSSYFHDLLSSGFSESKGRDINGVCPGPKGLSAEEYSYESDSDLDEEDTDMDYSRGHKPEASGLGDKQGTTAIRCMLLLMRVYSSGNESRTNIASQNISTDHHDSESIDRCVQLGHVICIQGHAYKTWKSLVLYLHSGEIHFGPLRSQDAGSGRTPINAGSSLCSPKSMYRLADKLGLEDLKRISAEAIREKLDSHNIVEELFSKFTSWYPDIADIETEDFLALKDARGLEEIISGVVQGRIPHCRTVLWKIVNPDSIRPPSTRLPAVSRRGGHSSRGRGRGSGIFG